MDEKPKYTTIIHKVRLGLNISLNEYCLADTIYHLSNNPESKIRGWCYASKEKLGEFLGIHKTTVHSIINNLEKNGLIERDKNTRWIRTTVKWYKAIVSERIKMNSSETLPIVAKRYSQSRNATQQSRNATPNSSETLHNNNKDNNNIYIKEEAQKISPDPVYESIEQTYKTKKKIFEQKGLEYKPKALTEKQSHSIEALSLITYFRSQAKKKHGLKFLLDYKEQMASGKLSARNKKIRNLFLEGLKKVDDGKKFVDWYLVEGGAFCNYSPDACFADSVIEKYLNRKSESSWEKLE